MKFSPATNFTEKTKLLKNLSQCLKNIKRIKWHILEKLRFFWFSYYFTLMRKPRIMKILGVKHLRSSAIIEIDITYYCQLKCFNCNRSCRQAPSDERMTVLQIKKFIAESIANNVKWKMIRLLGGEPLTHPDILEIINVLLDYKNNYFSDSIIELVTSGFGQEVRYVLDKIPKAVKIKNFSKKSPILLHSPFNMAPQDSRNYKAGDFPNGCAQLSVCGMGLSLHGYYCCAIAAGIDRVFGFDIGRKSLPLASDLMLDQMQRVCKLCGISSSFRLTKKELISASWREAYERYKKVKPELTLY